MNTTRGIRRIAFAITAVLLAACSSNPTSLPAGLTGNWTGDARIIVVWAKQKHLPVALEIHPDATVTGTVGDATLVDASVRKNRTDLGRQLNLATDYIITGDLTSPLIAAEHITRDSLNIPFNLHGRTIKGGIHTSGQAFGGKAKMSLSATSLQLTQKQPAEKH